ncbi:DUF3139 domain-containing protein [Bacillus sp. D386]|uniref:DUF3139 domain-containing protein n=1 Tax=Bacillus sp. D386 TaxID=2587155 RepID=UPI0015D650C8|nr:DUF3139 domain-containing protein [Bacillus sp. D386]
MSKKTLIRVLIAIVIIIAGAVAYVQGKHYVTRKEVKNYLLNEEGYSESDITEMQSVTANLQGDKNWLVLITVKGDKGRYYYYYDRDEDKVLLETYIINDTEYTDPAEAREDAREE